MDDAVRAALSAAFPPPREHSLLNPFPAEDLPPEGYCIDIAPGGEARIRAGGEAGRFYAKETLKRILEKGAHGPLYVRDAPSYTWRGVHLDESRHFFGKKTVKRLLDAMSLCRLNRLHWHLFDDSGWRLEFPSRPELSRAGATRKAKKGFGWLRDLEDGDYGPFFYTRSDIEEIVSYAQERFIEIVPEVELPGHSGHILKKCYPQFACDSENPSGVFCLGNEECVAFLEETVSYVASLFPGEFLHIGGDEVDPTPWTRCPKCQALAKSLSMESPAGLQAWITERIVSLLGKLGKRAVGWDEILHPGLDKSAAVMDWRLKGNGQKAAGEGHDVIRTPHWNLYFDYTQLLKDDPVPYPRHVPPVPVSKVYGFSPREDIAQPFHGRILGAQCCNWSEWTCTGEELEWKIWPRAAAMAEVLWLDCKDRDYDEFEPRLKAFRDRLVSLGINAAPVSFKDGVDPAERPDFLELTLGTLDIKKGEDPIGLTKRIVLDSLPKGAWKLRVDYGKGIEIEASGHEGFEAAKGFLLRQCRREDDGSLSVSCLVAENGTGRKNN